MNTRLLWYAIDMTLFCEKGYQENEAHDLLANYLEDQGFSVDRKYLLDTAFRATVGIGSPHVTVICEYDALPGIGHACGHNLIAEVGVAAGLGIKAAMEAAGKPLGKVRPVSDNFWYWWL